MLNKEELLSESSDFKSCRIDKEKGIIYDVKVLTENGNKSYPQTTRSAAIKLLEGAKVNINHAHKLGNKEVKVEDRFGKIQNVRDFPDGTKADLRYDITDPRAPKIVYMAEHMPELLGLSIHGKGRCSQSVVGGALVCDEIYSIQSVDLVADAGSTKSLFESLDMDPVIDPLDALCGEITALVKDATKAPGDKLAAIGILLKVEPVTESKEVDESTALHAKIEALTTERDCRELCESLDVKVDDILLKALTRLDTADERRAFVTSVKRKSLSQAPRSGSSAPKRLSESAEESGVDRLTRLAATLRGA